MKKAIRIGGASGYWGDNTASTPQLLQADLDFIVYDYLAEITMSIMARARAKDPAMGYAADFLSAVLKPNLQQIADKGVRVLSNAGGVNPEACAAAVRDLVKSLGLDLKVAVVAGDDLMPKRVEIAEKAPRELYSEQPFPDISKVASINAYIGAFPVAAALDGGADIVITGRCVDSAVTLGACIHSFRWGQGDLDLLASGSLAGHLIECGPQATGGNFTDWELVADQLADIGYPVAEINNCGGITITKPADTGGLVSIGTVAEQMLYEIGDPQAYILPDVVCDFSQVVFRQLDENCVGVAGAKGKAPTDSYKVCATYLDGYRGTMVMNFYGADAEKKAQVFADATFTRADNRLRTSNAGDYTEKSIEILGSESQYGSSAQKKDVREVALKIACRHPSAQGIALLFKEASGMGLSAPPGLSGFGAGRPKPTPVVRLFSFLLPKSQVRLTVKVDGEQVAFAPPPVSMQIADEQEKLMPEPVSNPTSEEVEVPLIKLAWARSGDKGDKANIGVIARKAEYLPYIWRALDLETVKQKFDHFLEGEVERFYLPGCKGVNFLLHDVLGGGGVASLRADPQGKGYAQLLLAAMIPVPHELAEAL